MTNPEITTPVQQLIGRAAETLVNIAPSLPTAKSVEKLLPAIEQAIERGYFLPDEDDAVRQLFARYLTVRAALQSTLEDLRPIALQQLALPKPTLPEVFVVAYCTASLLVYSGRFLVERFRDQPVVWHKLNEAEPRFGIPRKQFTKIYRSLTSPANAWIFHEATRCWHKQKQTLLDQLAHDPAIQPVLEILDELETKIASKRDWYPKRRLKYRMHSLFRRNYSGYKNVTFGLFRVSGSLVAELRLKWKRKRVTAGVQRKLARLVRPGDVLITRHDDAASNLFLPGFWPHAALIIGGKQQCEVMGIELPTESLPASNSICVLEARKDGVLFRPLHDTLTVDACTLIRPRISPEHVRQSLSRAMTHAGKPYDFEFDFRRSDKLVCTEVVYRAYHGCHPFQFKLTPRMGRVCLSAEDLLDSALDHGWFDVVAVYPALVAIVSRPASGRNSY
jgi:hypothetical protein